MSGAEDRRLPPGLGGEIGEQVTLMVERLERLGVELRRGLRGLGRAARARRRLAPDAGAGPAATRPSAA